MAGPTSPAQRSHLLPQSWISTGARPSSGWLYVLDTNNTETEAQVLLVDPAKHSVEGSFHTGYALEMVLAPDGSRLYVASPVLDQHGILSVLNTTTGQTLQTVDLSDRMIYTIRPTAPIMAVSPDGRWLYVSRLRIIAPGHDEVSVAILDTAKGEFLPEDVPLPNCGYASPLLLADQLQIQCSDSNDARLFPLTAKGFAAAEPVASQGVQQLGQIVRYTASPDGRTIRLVTDSGHALAIDTTTRRLVQTEELKLPPGTWIPLDNVATSSDNARLYIGVGQRINASQRLSDQVLSGARS